MWVPDINVFHIKWIIGNHGNWKNQNPGGCFGVTSLTALPIQPQNRLILKFINLSVPHKGLLMQDWVFRLEIQQRFISWIWFEMLRVIHEFHLIFYHKLNLVHTYVRTYDEHQRRTLNRKFHSKLLRARSILFKIHYIFDCACK